MHMPKDQVDSYCLEARAELPSNKLKLDWVYPLTAESRWRQGCHVACDPNSCLFIYLISSAEKRAGLMALQPAVSNSLHKESAAPLVLFYYDFLFPFICC